MKLHERRSFDVSASVLLRQFLRQSGKHVGYLLLVRVGRVASLASRL